MPADENSMPAPDPLITSVRRALSCALAEAPHLDWPGRPEKTSGWAMDQDALRALAAVVKHVRPRHILEFGSGASTGVLASACECWSPAGVISSIEHDPVFYTEMATRLGTAAHGGRVALQLAPLVARECMERPLPMYHLKTEMLACPQAPDLVVIDGPPEALGGREGVLYQVLDLARPGTLILLDDASRAAEQTFIRSWKENLGGAVEITLHPGFKKGLASVIVRQAVRRDQLWEHRLALSVAEIRSAVQEDSLFVLADEDQWDVADNLRDRRFVRFNDRDGQSWGPPASGDEAVARLEQLRQAGARCFVLAWPAHWYLAAYPQLAAHLRARYSCLIQNQRVIVFDSLA